MTDFVQMRNGIGITALLGSAVIPYSINTTSQSYYIENESLQAMAYQNATLGQQIIKFKSNPSSATTNVSISVEQIVSLTLR